MRGATFVSLAIALLLAGAAAYMARDYLAREQQQLVTQTLVQPAPADEKPKNTIVVAKVKLEFGSRLTPDKLAAIEWPGEIIPVGSFKQIKGLIPDGTDENARFVVDEMEPGEPVLASRITLPGQRAKLSTALEPGKKAVSIRVNDVLGVAGFVLPGDRVDVMLTRSSNSRGNTYVDVLLQGVKVLAIDQIADDRKDQPSVVRTVTFEVDTQQAQKLVLAANVGTLSLALRNYSSSDVEKIDRMQIEDLTDPSRNERLAAEQAAARARAEAAAEAARLEREATEARMAEVEERRLAAERENAELERQRAAELARIAELEKLLSDVETEFSDKFLELQANLQKQVAEPAAPAPVQPEVVLPVLPENVKVGVIRNGKRAVYRVQQVNDGEPDEADGEVEVAVEAEPETFIIETGTGLDTVGGEAAEEKPAVELVETTNASEAPQGETDTIETFD